MNTKELDALFEKHDDEFNKFESVSVKRSNRPDVHAFLLLDSLIPDKHDIVSGAEHDEIFLSVEPEDLARVATEDQIVELIRCGIRYDGLHDCLAMFV